MHPYRYKTLLGLFVLVCLLAVGALSAARSGLAAEPGQQPGSPWQDVPSASLRPQAIPQIQVTHGRTLRLDVPAMQAILAGAPAETLNDLSDGQLLSLPLPDGGYGRFRVEQTPVMAPELAARYPEIRTYAGIGVDDPYAAARLDLTPQGFHAAIYAPGGTVYIDPLYKDVSDLYLSYNKADFLPNPANLQPEFSPVIPDAPRPQSASPASTAPEISIGTQLRTYRLALAATGEYTAYHGGTVQGALSAMATAMNRVNGIYERELAVRMLLVANNHQIIYTNSATDPYTNNNGSTMLGQNQTNLDNVIGSANYDIGHVFSTGGGGIASMGVPCWDGYKAQGVTGLSQPVGDPFYVDYVAHEMGHQFSAEHTYNGTSGACSPYERTANSAYEPGSGSTIMGYAGICGSDNLQAHSDDYFHSVSFSQITGYVGSTYGNCAVSTSTGNQPPVIAALANRTIPKGTPFMLTGSASDGNGDALTFGWEQYNLGAAGAPPPVSGYVTPPHFRSFNPATSPTRTFPRRENLFVAGSSTLGELLPQAAATLNFRLTVRDGRPGGGGVTNAAMAVTIDGSSGPFKVTAPDQPATWQAGMPATVTWNVAGTSGGPVSCANVDIQVTVDGGLSYPYNLAMGTPNDGTQSVTAPSITTGSGRVRVKCSNNIFFDVSDNNFAIEQLGGPRLSLSAPVGPVMPGSALVYSLQVINANNAPITNFQVVDTLPAGVTFNLASPGCLHSSSVVTCSIASLAAGGTLNLSITAAVNGNASGSLANSAQLSGTFTDPNTQDNSASATTYVAVEQLFLPFARK